MHVLHLCRPRFLLRERLQVVVTGQVEVELLGLSQ
jgi:hypothetical protein